MSLQDGSVKITVGRSRGKIALAFLGIVELVLTAVFVVTLASNILFPDQTSAAANAVSKIISYEGRLTDASGNPLGGTGTNYCFRFSIYDNATVGAGTKLWPTGTPTTNTVNVVNGVFTVGIGEADDLGSYNFYDNDTIFLNIEATSSLAASCAGQTSFVTLSPRQRIDAVAFARASRDVYGNLLKTVNASNLVQIGSGTGAASPILLGLDWKNVADGTLSYVGQSCSVNGTMWYNSSVSRALICEGGLVQELGSAATTTVAAIGTNASAPISAGTVVFSNANGVTFGQNGSTITASVNAGGGGPALQGSGTYTQNTGTIQFANSNGITFGLSNNGVMTASHNGLTTARASNDAIGLNTALTGNGVAWTVNSSGLSLNIPAFLTTAMASNAGSNFFQANAAFNGTNISGTIASNALSLSVAAPGGGGGAAISAGANSQNTGTVNFANSNGITFGLSNNGTMTASHNGITNFNFSAGTTSNNLSNIVFSNSNGVSFGLNGSTVTASVAAGGGGGGATLSYYFPMNGMELQAGQQGQGTLHMRQVNFPNLHMDRIVFPVLNTNATNSSGSHTVSFWYGIYTKNASTLSLLQSASTSLAVTHSGTVGSYSLYSGIRNVSVGLTTTLTDGNYWVGVVSRTTSGGANGTYSQLIGSMIASNNLGWWSSSHNTTYQGLLGVGVYSATTSGMPASIAFSQIRGSDSLAYRYPAYWFVSNTI